MKHTIDLTNEADIKAAQEHIRRECRLNGWVVVDWDLESARKYVVVQKKRVIKSKPKARFFA